jgi:hypothetical protein
MANSVDSMELTEQVAMIAEEIRAIAVAGESATSMLRRIQSVVGKTDCKLISIMIFRTAFDVGIAAVSPVAGWAGFGGELSDSEVDAFLESILRDYRTLRKDSQDSSAPS